MSMPAAGLRWAWRREAGFIACGLGGGLLLGAIAGQILLFLLLVLAAYLVLQLLYAFQLHRWLVSDAIESADGLGVWREIYTELYRLKRRNRRRKRRLQRIVDEYQASTAALPDGAVVLDSQARIEWFNDAAAALLGLRNPQDRGQRIANLLRHPLFSRYLARADHASDTQEIPSPTRPGDTLLLRLIASGNDQRLLVARNISEQKRLEVTRRDFVANASHELRTPLTVLHGYLDMMESEAGAAGEMAVWQAPIHEMHAQARRMDRIIAGLLTLARVEAKGPAGAQERVDVPAMLARLIDDIRRTAGAEHEIVTDIAGDLALYGRPGELESIFSNLLANAARYTPAGGRIKVIWRTTQTGVRFAVTDTGPGIEAAHIPRLTERFYRVDTGRDAATGGTGLGLAIVKHCLEHHEGELVIDSTPGQGSVFTCDFPARRQALLDAA